jgi:hypothetical protein
VSNLRIKVADQRHSCAPLRPTNPLISLPASVLRAHTTEKFQPRELLESGVFLKLRRQRGRQKRRL